MSVPARKLPSRRPNGHGMPAGSRGAGADRRAQRGDGAKRPLRSEATRATSATRRHRNKHHAGFAILASSVSGLLVFAIVVLHVLLAQLSFRVDAAEQRIEELGRQRLELVTEQATLSAPGRIAEWADRHGMRLPDDIRILRAPNGPSDPAGTGTSSEGSG